MMNLSASDEMSIVSGVTLAVRPNTLLRRPVIRIVSSPSDIFADSGARLKVRKMDRMRQTYHLLHRVLTSTEVSSVTINNNLAQIFFS
jgi:hypothetical protein